MISNFLSKINKEDLKEIEKLQESNIDERIEKLDSVIKVLIDEIRDLLEVHEKLNNKVKNIEEQIKKLKAQTDQLNSDLRSEVEKKTQFDERIKSLEDNIQKFVSLYELITNQYNPFIKKNKTSEKQEIRNKEKGENNQVEIPVTGKKIVIEDSLSGEKKEISSNSENSFQSFDIPKGNKMPSELAKRELLWLKYKNKKDDLKEYFKDLNVSDSEIDKLINELEIKENPQDPQTLKSKISEINNIKDIEDAQQKLFEIFKNYPRVLNEIKSAKSLDEIKHILLRETLNNYITLKEVQQNNSQE